MLPLHDDLPTRSRPWITFALLVANIAAFVYLISRPDAAQARLVVEYGVVPSRLLRHLTAPEWATLVTSQFLHAGWLHLGGNMLVLWIFGNNVEDRLGRARYLLFYLACGVVAGLAQVLASPSSDVPGIGASGAIAGVLAAYLVWFPRARVVVLVPIFILPWLVALPAVIVIGAWFALQLVQGVLSLEQGLAGAGGVAWWAHVGGFAAGLVLAGALAPPVRGRSRW